MSRSLDVVLPVYNESKSLVNNFEKLYKFMELHIDYDWVITIAENGSSDNTLEIAKNLQKKFKKSRVISNEKPGKGLAIKNAWLSSNAEIFAYMDIDLSTDIELMPMFLKKIDQGKDFVIGSRLIKNSKVIGRSIKRELISRSYSKVFRFFLSVNFFDAQCGFKFVKKESALKILDECKDSGWFFDTEILYKAEQQNLSICELPVTWIDDPDSKVNILSTIIKDLMGLIRLRLGK